MSANAVSAPYDWFKESTEEGDEIYTLKWKVETTAVSDGPDVAWTAAGLPENAQPSGRSRPAGAQTGCSRRPFSSVSSTHT